jgi:hypothetical protein
MGAGQFIDAVAVGAVLREERLDLPLEVGPRGDGTASHRREPGQQHRRTTSGRER